MILKLNNHDVLHDERDPISAVTGSVNDALRLGCAAVGFTIYPGSSECKEMYEQLREIASRIDSGIIRPVVDRVFAFESTKDALAYVETGRAKGKVVIKVR